MEPRERMEAFWAGERPDKIPFSMYSWFKDPTADDPAWRQLEAAGLIYSRQFTVFKSAYKDVVTREASYEEDGKLVTHRVMRTPVGEIHSQTLDGWTQEYWLKTPEDYRVMAYIARNTEYTTAYHDFIAVEHDLDPNSVLWSVAGRTPIQTILVDMVGLENFAMHLFDLEAEMMELYDALLNNFRRRMEIVAGGPGRYVAIMENFTAETMGPDRFAKFHLPVYREIMPMVHETGKIAGTHYDGKLASCRELVAQSPVDLIESLTPPPEGDMTFDHARKAWPDKLFWANINVSSYQLPPAQLRQQVLDLVQQAAPDGRRLAFEVSEELPANWRESLPIVLEALEETRA